MEQLDSPCSFDDRSLTVLRLLLVWTSDGNFIRSKPRAFTVAESNAVVIEQPLVTPKQLVSVFGNQPNSRQDNQTSATGKRCYSYLCRPLTAATAGNNNRIQWQLSQVGKRMYDGEMSVDRQLETFEELVLDLLMCAYGVDAVPDLPVLG